MLVGQDASVMASADAVDYFREMWRVLSPGGLFVLVSTMTEEVLNTLIASPLELLLCSNWKRCPKVEFTTSAGGKVHYYALKKSAELSTGKSRGTVQY